MRPTPIEILARDEVEKLVEEKLKKLLLEMEISKKFAELGFSIAKLRDDIAKLSRRPCSLSPSLLPQF